MNRLEQNILQALTELAEFVKKISTVNNKSDLKVLFANIDELAAQLPRDADPTLVHYLEKKSYEKARLWLEGRAGEVSTSSSNRCG